ncbi:hypothetical protein [Bacteroides sp.]
MKKVKRIFLIVFSVILVGGILQQLYYRVTYEGNLVFYISNESLKDSVQLEIFIDGTKIVSGNVVNSVSFDLYSAKTTFGDHAILVKMNGEVTKEVKLNTFLVTFMVVEYYGDRLDIPSCEDREHFYINVRKCPIRFIA